jgi:RHH-type transcriptional regulator, proline utilization regulon repressor / proline dehydrogenase / delta 1-pyrroline-5-carboxylate dehydrogenase
MRDWVGRTDRPKALRLPGIAPDGLPDRALEAATSYADGPISMPGPTGESNQLHHRPRGVALCLGPAPDVALAQAAQALAMGGAALMLGDAGRPPGLHARVGQWREAGVPVDLLLLPGGLGDFGWLTMLQGFGLVAFAGSPAAARAIRLALARREGEILPLVTEVVAPWRYALERHICIDTTAAGGNASLLAA